MAGSDTEFGGGKRDKRNRFVHPHVVDAPEALTTIHIGESKKASDRVDHFQGLEPLPAGLKPYKYATPRWKGSFRPKED